MNEFGQKNVVPLLERLSLSPEEASVLTGIGLTINRYGAPGLGLVEQRFDIQDNRFMKSRLTAKGVSLVR
jgi:hypothetical protein